MDLQDPIIIGLAIAALILSILSIVFGIIFFRMQMQQASSMTVENLKFTQEMKILLGEIRISQTATEQQMTGQFDKVLDAALHGGGISPVDAAASSAVQLKELEDRFKSFDEAVKGPGVVESQIDDVKDRIEKLTKTVSQLATGVVEEERQRPRSRFEKFSGRARVVLTAAQEEAAHLYNREINPEHILLGIIRDTDSVASRALTNLGVDLDRVRSAIEFVVPKAEEIITVSEGGKALAPQGKVAIELAIDEAQRFGHDYIGTEHLLLGILLEAGIAASVLHSLDVTLQKTRNEVVKILSAK